MSLQRRLLLYLLLCAPLVWAAGLTISVHRARHEVNELFDSEMVRLARQVQVTLHPGEPAAARPESVSDGEADLRDFAIAVWDAQGHLQMADRGGATLPWHADTRGFIDTQVDGEPWRVYVLQSPTTGWRIAAGQKADERDELVLDLTVTQVLPWVLVLPVLLLAMAWGVKRALAPVRELAAELQARSADELQPLDDATTPSELKPLVGAMNLLFGRIEKTLAHERRFTAEAAHELRTPLAALRAQWDVVRRAATPAEREAAEHKLGHGIQRLDRLVGQMLALSRLEGSEALARRGEIRWPPIVEQAMSDCLPLAERRRIELGCDWPAGGAAALPLMGDAELITVLLRNLLDNAIRYSPAGSAVQLRMEADRVELDNEGRLDAEQLARLGERFYRPQGQEESGSGLGVSIVQRIAALHGLVVSFGSPPGGGVRVTLSRTAAADQSTKKSGTKSLVPGTTL